MLGDHFYHQRIRKAVAVFGSLFNDIKIIRKSSSGNVISQVKVPLSYAPRRDFLARIDAMNNGEDAERQIAVKLPRMSFEILAMQYDAARQLPKTNSCTKYPTTFDGTGSKIYTPVPYLISFQLNIYAKSQDDALQVVEQILPYFTPQYTVTVKPLDDFDILEDTPITLTGTTFSDDYEAPLEARRTIIYTLDFDMKINLYKSINTGSSIIYGTSVNFYDFDDNTVLYSTLVGDPAFDASSTTAVTAEDTTVTVSTFEVLNLPSEPTEFTVSDPANGSATATLTEVTTNQYGRIDAKGTWTYTPNADYNGTDTFNINVLGKDIPINVTITPLRDLENDSVSGTYSDAEPFIVFSVASNDDPEASPVVYSVAAGGQPSNGTITVVNAATGVFAYYPTLGYSGADVFIYRVSSETGSSEVAYVILDVVYTP